MHHTPTGLGHIVVVEYQHIEHTIIDLCLWCKAELTRTLAVEGQKHCRLGVKLLAVDPCNEGYAVHREQVTRADAHIGELAHKVLLAVGGLLRCRRQHTKAEYIDKGAAVYNAAVDPACVARGYLPCGSQYALLHTYCRGKVVGCTRRDDAQRYI